MQRGFAGIIVIGGLAILLLLAGAFYLGRLSTPRSSTEPGTQTMPTSTVPIPSGSSPLPEIPSTPPDLTLNWRSYTSESCPETTVKYPPEWNYLTKYLTQDNDFKKVCAYLVGPDYREIPNSDGISGIFIQLRRTLKGTQFKDITINNLNDYLKAEAAIIDPGGPEAVSHIQARTYGSITGTYFEFSAMSETSNFIFESEDAIYEFNWLVSYDKKYTKELESIMSSIKVK